ncbi:hypothetical protein [Lentimicrobium sp.]|uniref:hypothetical protein n=1 Tax=Lentimicrobium sp. TaxID=2034841 RepID=UPI00345EEC4C
MPGENELVKDILGEDFSATEEQTEETEEQTEDQQQSEQQEEEAGEKTEEEEEKTEDSAEETEESENENTEDSEEKTEEKSEEESETEEKPEEKEADEVDEINEELLETARMIDPEAEFANPAELNTFLKDKVKTLQDENQQFKEIDGKIFDLLSSDERIADFFTALFNKVDPKTAAAVYILETEDPDVIDTESDEFRTTKKSKEEADRNKKQAAKEYEDNYRASLKDATKYIKDNNIDPNEYKEAMKTFDDMTVKLSKGVYPVELYQMVMLFHNWEKIQKDHKAELETAKQTSYQKGRNERIKQLRDEKKKTDGIKTITTQSSKEKTKAEPDIFDRIANHQPYR